MAVALYARVSTGRQAEKDLSIPDQLSQMRAWCEREGHAVAVEYVEPGASARDDRRPVFQEMIATATLAPPPFEAVIVHSQSRFFRDAIEFGLYERRLQKAGVRLISITQLTTDDPAGSLARRMFSLFDEYQSEENAKHTLRAMAENARRGYFNGSTPPFGYRVVEVEGKGRRGAKKRLAVAPTEASVVREIFTLYLYGKDGQALGMKAIAEHLNEHGRWRRGAKWARGRVADVLADTTYRGEHFFNKREGKTRKPKPRSEWIRIEVEPIVEPGMFAAAQARREGRRPEVQPPGRVGSRTLLTGLLRCGHCGAGMTLATGKGGRYRYYRCTSRINKGNRECDAPNLPMERLDDAVLNALAERVFTTERVSAMLSDLGRRMKSMQGRDGAELARVKRSLNSLEKQQGKLFEAVEQGYLPANQALRDRAQKLDAQRQALLTELAGIRRREDMPLDKIRPQHVRAFSRALRRGLLEGKSGFGKDYLGLLVDEITVEGREVRITGSHARVAGAVLAAGNGGLAAVPRFGSGWLPGTGSNRRPSD